MIMMIRSTKVFFKDLLFFRGKRMNGLILAAIEESSWMPAGVCVVALLVAIYTIVFVLNYKQLFADKEDYTDYDEF